MADIAHPHFEVDPSVVYQLGESLISDAVQALIELVKNSYDADATYAKLMIDTHGSIEVEGSIYSAVGGRIIVEDDGHGMDIEEIKTGWLTLSNRKKREMKKAKKTTSGGRSPLGDKGLGRLGVQRLGENLEIFTKAEERSGYHFGFSWLDFATSPKLEDVDIHLKEFKFPRQHGTKVVVSGLKEPESWRGQTALKRLEQELSRLISPYRQIRNFNVVIEVDGKMLELHEISDRIRDIATMRYSLHFDGIELVVLGRARLDHFRPSNSDDSLLFALIAESDGGMAFFNFLKAQKQAVGIGLTRSRSNQWFVEFQYKRSLSDLDKVQRVHQDGAQIANPGAFFGEVDSFDLGSSAFRGQSVFNRIREYRAHIKDLSGIRVYRDGFGIRVDHDWLRLGAQWTSASSYYGLKPDNTLGYIALSARDNIELEETTDREGFKDSPYFRNFYALMEEFRSFTTKAHEFFGRSWSEFRKARNESAANVDSRRTVEDIAHAIKSRLVEAPQLRVNLTAFRKKLSASASASKAISSRLRTAKELTSELRDSLTVALSDLEPILEEATVQVDTLSEYLKEIAKVEGMGRVLEDRVDGLRRQMDEMYETIALGLTAEALSHEVFNVADQLAKRTSSAQMTLRKRGVNDLPMFTFIEYVQSSVTALRKQMSFLSPSLRYVREQRHELNVREFVDELSEIYRDRLGKNRISFEVRQVDSTPFHIRMNKGKLMQVLDNLLLNSEYWLKEDIAQGRIAQGTITVSLARPFLRISDDGSGIDPSVEYTLFEPFISAKKQGRGLGLFIVKQLLDSQGCSIGIVPERNARRRLFMFQIDLRGVLHE